MSLNNENVIISVLAGGRIEEVYLGMECVYFILFIFMILSKPVS